ncbi:hypothetical protein BGX33_004538 [Mortierella sp. NVP41]|nr:hypothetical protein BGX33_004538 [Mortierella sp. NVP41]
MLRKIGDFISDPKSLFQGDKWGFQFPMFGLPGAGKTTILYRLLLNECVTTVPDHNFRIETVKIQIHGQVQGQGQVQEQRLTRELKYTLWDVCGQSGIIPLWKFYMDQKKGVIFVVNSVESALLTHVKVALWQLYDHYDTETRDSILLVFANMQDREEALSVTEVMKGLDLEGWAAGTKRRWHIRGTVGTTGEGLVEGLLWLYAQIQRPPRPSVASSS